MEHVRNAKRLKQIRGCYVRVLRAEGSLLPCYNFGSYMHYTHCVQNTKSICVSLDFHSSHSTEKNIERTREEHFDDNFRSIYVINLMYALA